MVSDALYTKLQRQIFIERGPFSKYLPNLGTDIALQCLELY